MKLSEWGTIAEIVSAVAVIITLLILVAEVRSNTQAIERNFQQESFRLGASARTGLFEIEGLSELIIKHNNEEELSEAELFKLNAHGTYVLRNFEIQYNLAQSGELPPEQEAILKIRTRRSMSQSRLFHAVIASCEECYATSFLEWINYQAPNQ